LTLPWLLYVGHVQNPEAEATEIADPVTGEEKLNPLPPERRRRGMLAIGGGTATIQAMIEFAVDGCSREDFMEHLQSISPISKRSTFNTQLNALIAEWGVLRAQGGELQLTPRGEAFLESGDPDEVIDWMITRVLGFDYLLSELHKGPITTRDAILVLRKVNPGWASDFAPTSLINWLRNLQLIDSTDRVLTLTKEGEEWVERIHWEPRGLPDAQLSGTLNAVKPQVLTVSDLATRPSLIKIIEGFDPGIRFSAELIGQLDAGLWSHNRRHFAVLTGLSGSGKTQLARGYALSLWQDMDQPQDGLLILPVQPGWHDPSSLLGYVNPLETDTYIRTGVLDFLLQASANPSRPYTLVLDEMNLSHPEQYLAPLLSAMETGDALELHAQNQDVSDVPSSLPYPANLLIIGTVNMDETTHGLSDKVLDRASVIEFWDINVGSFPGWKTSTLTPDRVASVQSVMSNLMDELRPVRLHFGWRTLHDVIGYVQEAERGGVIEFTRALDQAIYSKVLPKLRGEDSPRLQEVFRKVSELLEKADLKSASLKVREMREDLQHSGSARFWR
jgi:5-methylcytosine-specific restriction protein B